MLKKVIATALTIVMCLGIGVTAFAADLTLKWVEVERVSDYTEGTILELNKIIDEEYGMGIDYDVSQQLSGGYILGDEYTSHTLFTKDFITAMEIDLRFYHDIISQGEYRQILHHDDYYLLANWGKLYISTDLKHWKKSNELHHVDISQSPPFIFVLNGKVYLALQVNSYDNVVIDGQDHIYEYYEALDNTFSNWTKCEKPTNTPDFFKREYYSYDGTLPETIKIVDYITPSALTTTAASTAKATPTASKVYINGKEVSFDAYNINGNNYFKLRDIAYSVSGTEKQFDVSWDGEKNAINLLSNKAYTVTSGEMAKGDGTTKNATLTTSTILLDDKEIKLTAYNIGGNNYFKLRDLGKTFDFATDWDGANNAIMIDTAKAYTE